eukprot:141055-Prorocentrum_minimum.AAC.2
MVVSPDGEKVLVVTHGGVINSLHLLATGKPPPSSIINCGMYRLWVPSEDQKYWVIDDKSWEKREIPGYLRDVGFQEIAFGGGSRSG